MFIKERHPPLLDKYCSRVPIASNKYPPNENRFEIINKSPDCLSFNKHVMNLKINKQEGHFTVAFMADLKRIQKLLIKIKHLQQ